MDNLYLRFVLARLWPFLTVSTTWPTSSMADVDGRVRNKANDEMILKGTLELDRSAGLNKPSEFLKSL